MDDQGIDTEVEYEPRVDMLFTSEEQAYTFYCDYGGKIGFSVRKAYSHKRKTDKSVVTSRKFLCNKSGLRQSDKRDNDRTRHRAETRTNCPARMGITLVNNGQYRCNDFVKEHNHPLHVQGTLHMMRSQRKLSHVHALEIDLTDDSRVRPKDKFEYMGGQVGGRENLGYTQQYHKNYLRTRRQRDLVYGEACTLLMHFEKQTFENPAFIYRIQLDIEEQITNVFWADPRMILDYALFGDVITFDTTFCTSKEYRPFGLFAGFNHHREIVILGAALLYDKTVESFKWLFEAFLEVNGHKKPITMFTDQDVAIAKAIQEVFPDTWHGLCTWHIIQNGIKHLGNLMKHGSSFLKDFSACMYQFEDEQEFESAWEKLKTDFSVNDDSWLHGIYELREKWANCYMKKTFTLGMQSTQIGESVNADFKKYVKASLDVVQFFNHFERVLNDKRHNELRAEFNARNTLPRNVFVNSPVMKQAGEIYTPKIFENFHEEYGWISACYIKSRKENDGVLRDVVGVIGVNADFTVLTKVSELVIKCSCRKFESFGILCCHALKILDVLDIKCIPAAYVLTRWTRAARNMVVGDKKKNIIQDDVHLDYVSRYRDLCPRAINVVIQACNSVKGHALLNNALNEVSRQLQNLDINGVEQESVATNQSNVVIPRGLQKKE